MLKTRVLTAVVLLAILLPVLFYRNMLAFGAVVLAFMGAALWEAYRLVQPNARYPVLVPLLWTLAFAMPVMAGGLSTQSPLWWGLAAAAWLLVFAPKLKTGLPDIASGSARIHGILYMLSIVAAFMAITALYRHSPVYLLSVMALVWIADIGAYFSGKAFGKRKLAVSISPGKSWEGAIGGGIAVLLIAAATVFFAGDAALLADTFAVQVQAKAGWLVLAAVLLLLVAASVIGDLAESQLKRRAAIKDSSNLLPGHGGVLDRIDALVPVLPIAALIDAWL
ncbi:phosphatidate cytidylyltransferase [Pseudoduganella sp. GCM10020061]|uniref:phosphatidate cytidylyltransferase n=1 Tax=Pseudoduganella sp. GCM10020061 TaxID=3317345 RepID=UPI0036292BAA